MSQKTNLMKNTLLLSFGAFLTKGINFIMIPLFSAWLSTEEYGTFDLLCTYITLLIPFITFSNSDAIFRLSIDKNDLKQKSIYVTNGLIINLINTIITISIILLIYFLSGWKYAIPFICLLIVELLYNHFQGFLRSIKSINLYTYSNIISTIGIACFVAILVLKYQFGLYGIVYGYALGYILGELFIVIKTKYWKYVNFKLFNKQCIKDLIKYSFPLIPNNISWWVINVSDRTLINLFLGPIANGIYAIAYKIPNFCSSIFSTFSISWQEAAIDVVGSKGTNEYYNKVYNGTISTMISLCGGMLAINYFLFKYIFDIRYFDASLYAPILITSVIFGSLIQYFGGIQISMKKTKANGITTLIGAIVNVVINLALIKSIGLYAAAISTLISNIIVCIIRYIQLNKIVNFKYEKKTFIWIIYYIYLFVCAYIYNSLCLSIINLFISIGMFIIINKDILLTIEKKIIKKIRALHN